MTQPPSSDDPFGGLPPREGEEPGDEPTRSFDAPAADPDPSGPFDEPAPSPQAQDPSAQYPQQPAPAYGPVYAYGPPPGWRPQPATHPAATTALVLGLVGLVGGMACLLPFFLAPFAWIKGSSALKAIDAEPERHGGRTEAITGKILGIIGTVLLVLGVLAVAALIVLAIVSPESFESDTDY